LYFYILIEKITFKYCNFESQKLKQFYEKGRKNLKKDFDFLKILKNIRKQAQNDNDEDFVIDLEKDLIIEDKTEILVDAI
jgi:hypothetical protein